MEQSDGCLVVQRAALAIHAKRGVPWTPEDARLDVSWVPHGAPAFLRRRLAVPRCTNTVSLYLYLVVQIVLQVYVHTFIRRMLQRSERASDSEYWQRTIASPIVVALISAAVSATLSQLTFSVINRTLLPFVDEPSPVFNIAFAISVSIIMSRTEHVVLSLPVLPNIQ